jgi:hypothetical protein
MRGREFIKPARTLANQTTEADWRGAAVHAYYALFLECRDLLSRWGQAHTGRHNVHPSVRLKFVYSANADLKQIGKTLENLGNLRSLASYNMTMLSSFASATAAKNAINHAVATIALLDAIETDPQRRSAAIASLPP